MNLVYRGIKNAFRNSTRLIAIVVIVGIVIGLSLAMLVARSAVNSKINQIKSNVGTTITIQPAGIRGFSGAGNPLTQSQIDKIKGYQHITSISESLNARLRSSQTNLVSDVNLNNIGRRFFQNQFGGNGPTLNFTPPVTFEGTTDPTNLTNSIGGGTFKLQSGTTFNSTANQNVAMLGSNLATKNNLKVGSSFTAYNNSIKVIGIYTSGNSFSNNQVLMPLTTLQNLSSQPNVITEAIVNVDSLSNINSLTSKISSALGSSADVSNSIQQTQNALNPLKNIQTISLYSFIGAIVAAAIIIFLLMVMIVRERRKEIGVLKAIGASNSNIILQFVVESITLTLLGSIVGIIFGFISSSPITKVLVSNSNSSNNISVLFGSPESNLNNVRHHFGRQFLGGFRNNLANVHAIVGWSIVMEGVAIAVGIGIIGSLAATTIISKIRPLEVIRTE